MSQAGEGSVSMANSVSHVKKGEQSRGDRAFG